MLHIACHFLIPVLLSVLAGRSWRYAYSLMVLTMLIDVDHLLAQPMYDPLRCSINFHPLHKLYLLPLYLIFALQWRWYVVRWLGIGLCLHMLLDSLDCLHSQGVWFHTA